MVYYIQNAAAMSVTTSATATITGNLTTNYNVQVEFSLYEFSGAATTSVVEQNTVATGTSSTPNAGTLTSSGSSDMIFVGFAGNPSGSNLTAGSGYTLGVDASVVTVGQNQYILNVAPGANATAFSGGTSPAWGGMAVAFKVASAPSPAARHGGTVF